MLKKLKQYYEIGEKSEIIYFLQTIIDYNEISMKDIKTLSKYSSGHINLNLDALVSFFVFFEIVNYDIENEIIRISPDFAKDISPNLIIDRIIYIVLHKLFEQQIFTMRQFSYDSTSKKFIFNNEHLGLEWAVIRNTLISLEFLILKDDSRTIFEVSSKYESILGDNVKKYKKKVTLEQLKASLIRNEVAGEIAEKFVLSFEIKRLLHSEITKNIKQISIIDVSAGYDIVSFNSNQSVNYDRFIEVKAISKGISFYWSKNEIEIAKNKGGQYYLYLVEINKIHNEGYSPIIIVDPDINIIDSDEWLLEAQSFQVFHV